MGEISKLTLGDAVAIKLDTRSALSPEQTPSPENGSAESVVLTIANMHCGGCMSKVERVLAGQDGVATARVNLSAKRVRVTFDPTKTQLANLVDALDASGFKAAELAQAPAGEAEAANSDLLRRIGVAGFAAANVMLLSVSVWSGGDGDMEEGTRALFHWLSALIALPAIVYAGQPFFRAAAQALSGWRLSMDVPISLGVILAAAMSLFQTIRGGSDQVYFDAATMLLFFLLIGRYLDGRMRIRARGAAENLLALKANWATVIWPDGTTGRLPADRIGAGDRILAASGERIAADGIILQGRSDIDEALLTGETLPRSVVAGDKVFAGTLNLGAPLSLEVTAADDSTVLAEISRLMETAEQGRGRYVRLADRAARLYAPLVHILGALTFAGWLIAGAGWETALTTAIAVLIITCPCALALAVPAVQVAASSRLFASGIILKAADGLERIAEVDTVVFDKTGTLTLGEPRLINANEIDPAALQRAGALAAASRHPYARAVLRAAEQRFGRIARSGDVVEHAGLGLSGPVGSGEGPDEIRLGSAGWCGIEPELGATASLWLTAPQCPPVGFRFDDAPRTDAKEVIAALRQLGLQVEILSGDRVEAVRPVAAALGVDVWQGAQSPAAKVARLQTLADQGRKVLMVGDGLNDAPALASGHASLSPATAADISQASADTIFLDDKLNPVVELVLVARRATRMSWQNFGIAAAYNAVFVPIAVAGFVTPLIAAIAMSASSIAVTANAIRLRRGGPAAVNPMEGRTS